MTTDYKPNHDTNYHNNNNNNDDDDDDDDDDNHNFDGIDNSKLRAQPATTTTITVFIVVTVNSK